MFGQVFYETFWPTTWQSRGVRGLKAKPVTILFGTLRGNRHMWQALDGLPKSNNFTKNVSSSLGRMPGKARGRRGMRSIKKKSGPLACGSSVKMANGVNGNGSPVESQ